MSAIEPVEIDFVLKNINFEAEAKKMKAEIAGVGDTTQRTAERVKAALSDNNVKYNQAATGVNQYSKSISGLSFSMQQVARELPSLAISPQMFFLAISNNLPILADNIKRVREENNLLKAAGQQTVPVYKQIISSIFSWQSALVAAITVLTVWGKDIVNGVSNLFKFRSAIKLTADELENLNTTFNKNAGGELGTLKYLFDQLNNAKKGTIEYLDAKKEIIKQYGSYLKGMDSEITTLNNAKLAYDELNKSIYENAKSKTLKSTYDQLGQNLVNEKGKQLGDIYEQLISKYGKNAGSAFFDQIKTELESGKGLSYEMQRVVESFKKTMYTAQGTSITGAVQGAGFVDVNKLNEAVKAYAKAQADFDTKIADARRILETRMPGNAPQVKSLIDIQQGLLDQAKLMPEATENEIKAKNKKIEAVEKEIKRLQELGKTNKETKGIESEIKAVEEKIIKASGKELDFLAAKLVLLQTELELRRQISNAAILKVKDPATEKIVQANQPITPKGIFPIIQKGSTKTQDGILYEVTAIDKTGPVWTKVKGEISKLKKFEKEQNKEAAKEQEDLYDENFKKRQQFEEDLLNYSRQFTTELIDQLGLTQEQSKELNGLADTIYNLASGNYLGAAFSAASTLLTAIFSGSGNEDSTTKALERTNQLLNQQAAILANMDNGKSYFKLAAKQYEEYGTAIDLTNQKLQQSYIITNEEQSKLLALPTKPAEYRGNDPFEKAQYKKELEEYNKARVEINKVTAEIAAGMNERKNWTPDQFIAAYANGSLILDKQQIDWITEITEKQKERAELLQETFRQALGFDSSEVSDSITQGIEAGLKLGENSLGGFAASFGEQIKTALVKNITEAMNLKLTEGFMTDFNSFMLDGVLSADERKKLEEKYIAVVREGSDKYNAIQSIIDSYGAGSSSGSTALKGISASATEDTVSAMIGQFMAIRTDVKDILKQVAAGQDDVGRNLLYMKQIADNTSYNKELVVIRDEMKEMNRTLKDRL